MARIEAGKGRVRRMKKGGKPVGDYYFVWKGERIFTGTRDKAEAARSQEIWVAEKLRQQQRLTVTFTNATFSDLLALVRADYQRKGRRTLDSLNSRLKVLESDLGPIRALDLGPADVDCFIEAREEDGLKAASINRYLETIRRALNLGRRRKWVVEPPYVEMLPVNNERNEDLSPAEYRELLSILREPVRLMFVIAYHIGWRSGAIKSLQWPQVDLDGGVIHAPQDQRGKKVGDAPIYLDLRKELLQARFRRDQSHPNCPWVCHRSGRPVSTYRAEWERARALIGRPNLHFHDLRGVAETNMVEWGLSEARARAIVGHRDSKMLERYKRTSDRRTREARDILERFHERLAGTEQSPKPSN